MKNRLVGSGAMALVLALLAVPVAGPAEAATQGIGFVTSAVLPENQLTDVGYFNLVTPPGSEQTLYVEVINKANVPLTFDIGVNDASSGPHGVISYAGKGEEDPPQARLTPEMEGALRLSDIARLQLEALEQEEDSGVMLLEENRLTLSPHTGTHVPIRLTLPPEPLQGQVLGGVVVTRVDPEKQQEAFGVHSVYSYAIAIQLQSERETAVAPAFELCDLRMTQLGGFPAITVTVLNKAPLVVAGAQLQIQVTTPGQSQPPVVLAHERVAMAPLSVMPFAALLPQGTDLSPGSYRVQLRWTYAGQTLTMDTELTCP